MSKPSKVLIIGSGPIIIGQFYCHSERAERLKNLGVEWQEKPCPDTLRYTQGDKEEAQGDNEGAQSDKNGRQKEYRKASRTK